MNIKIKNNFGFTLLETLVALSVLTFAALGPLSLATYTIRAASVSQNQFTAFFLAQEAMEYIRNRRDSNILSGANWLDGMAPAGAGNGLCRGVNGCIADVPNNNIQTCNPPGCSNIKYNSVSGLYNYSSGSSTIFMRKFKLTYISNYEEKIEVTISWQDKFGLKSFTIEENIFNWQ